MLIKNKRNLLAAYGLGRLILGCGQLVGLTAGYLMLEFIIRYPQGVYSVVFNEDIVVLAYLTVFLRALFHIFTGIGIAQCKEWGRAWILYGWPLMLIITFGFVWSLGHDWMEEGLIDRVSQSFIGIKLLTYAAIIVFDTMIVNQWIGQINTSRTDHEALGEMIDAKKIAIVIFAALFFFSVILYMGRPIRQGFHKGYLKTKGKQVSIIKSQKSKIVKKAEKKRAEQKELPKAAQREEKAQKPLKDIKLEKPKDSDVLQSSNRSNVVKDKTKKAKKSKKETVEKGSVRSGFAYRTLIGYVSGLCLIVALLMQVLSVYQGKTANEFVMSFYTLLGLGFFLMVVYAISIGVMPFVVTGIVACSLCVSVVLMLVQKNN